MTRKSVLILTAMALLAATPVVAGDFSAKAAFEKLKDLAGTWSETASDEDGTKATHVFQVSAAGTVVMETMFAGSDHEMINMYHLDGDSLVLTHYCAGGNQPRMRMAAASSADDMIFEFDGGTNLDPETDSFIHDARLVFEGDVLESNWASWSGGKEHHKMVFTLRREGN